MGNCVGRTIAQPHPTIALTLPYMFTEILSRTQRTNWVQEDRTFIMSTLAAASILRLSRYALGTFAQSPSECRLVDPFSKLLESR